MKSKNFESLNNNLFEKLENLKSIKGGSGYTVRHTGCDPQPDGGIGCTDSERDKDDCLF